jgi:hypothetical protein
LKTYEIHSYYINIRETRRRNQEWTIQRHRQSKTQDEVKQNKKHKTKKNKTKNTRRRKTKQKTRDEEKQNKKHKTEN